VVTFAETALDIKQVTSGRKRGKLRARDNVRKFCAAGLIDNLFMRAALSI
jgi:hypothetical protein